MAEHGSAGPAAPGHRHHLPPMGRTWLLPLYDPLTRLAGIRRVHRRLIDTAGLRAGHRVLEIGCGTGNLLLEVKRQHPEVDAVGLDPDVDALDVARRKVERAGVSVALDRGFAGELPYPDASVDRVLSSLMLHHLDPAEKPRALREVRRVLRPGGSLHLVDMGGPVRREGGLGYRMLRRNPHLVDNLGEAIPDLMREAGLVDVAETGHGNVLLTPYTCYRATRS